MKDLIEINLLALVIVVITVGIGYLLGSVPRTEERMRKRIMKVHTALAVVSWCLLNFLTYLKAPTLVLYAAAGLTLSSNVSFLHSFAVGLGARRWAQQGAIVSPPGRPVMTILFVSEDEKKAIEARAAELGEDPDTFIRWAALYGEFRNSDKAAGS